MGYIHDANMFQFLPPELAKPIDAVKSWIFTGFDGANCYHRAAGAGSATLSIPIFLPANSVSQRGAYFKYIDIYYKINVAALTTLSATIPKYTLPINGLSFASANQSFTYDTGHDGAAERVTAASHTMRLTPDTPFWMSSAAFYTVKVAITAPGTATFYYYGSNISYTLRL